MIKANNPSTLTNKSVSVFVFIVSFFVLAMFAAKFDNYIYAASSSAHKVLNGKIEISLPENFTVMPDEIRESKWPSKDFRPFLVFADESGTTQVTFFRYLQEASSANMFQIKNDWYENINKNHPETNWLLNEIKNINNQETGILGYVISREESKTSTYNLLLLAPFEGKLLNIGFHYIYSGDLSREQRQLANEVINSVKLQPNIFSYSRGFTKHLKTGLIFLIAGSILFYRGFRVVRTRRKWIDLPPSKIRSLAVGPIKIEGKLTTVNGGRETSPLTKNPCLFWATSVEDIYWNYATKGWRLIDYRGKWVTNLYLQDDTGRVKIDPSEFILWGKRSYRFTTLPLKKIPPSVRQLLQNVQISNKTGILGLHLPITRILRLEEYILNESDEVKIIGFAMPLTQSTKTEKQSEKLVITNHQNTDFVIISTDENVFKDKKVLLSIISGSSLLSVGFGLIARSYSLIQSSLGFLISISIVTTFAIFATLGYYKKRVK